MRDYRAWHEAYDDPQSALSKRLRRVQAEIAAFLDRTVGEVRFVSACAGDGRDILDVLAVREDAARVSGTFVEIDDLLVAAARRRVDAIRATGRIEVRRADAGYTDAYTGAVPADLVVLAGIMGNIVPADIERLIHTARSLCAPGATVIWTRGHLVPDFGPEIRRWFSDAGFEELALFEQIEGTTARVGVQRLAAEPTEFRPGQQIFTFYR